MLLALYLVKVGRDSGSETVEGILKVLKDEYFDLEEFVEKVKSFEDCSKLGKSLMDKQGNIETVLRKHNYAEAG